MINASDTIKIKLRNDILTTSKLKTSDTITAPPNNVSRNNILKRRDEVSWSAIPNLFETTK